METADQQLKGEWYANWVKCLFGVICTSKCLQGFVCETFSQFLNKRSILKSHQMYFTTAELKHIKFGGELRTCLKQCINDRFKRYNSNVYKWIAPDQCEGKCEKAFTKILALHRKFIPSIGLELNNKMFWENSDKTMGISLEWAIAKMFMPKGNKDNKGPEGSDPVAIFRVMQNCDLFSNSIRDSHLEKVIEARNKLCHSSNHSMTDTELDFYFDHMRMLLQDALSSGGIPEEVANEIEETIDQLNKLRVCEVCISEFDEALGW